MAESSLSSQHIRPEIRNKQKACETLSLENVDHNRSQTNKFQMQSKRSFTNKSILTYDYNFQSVVQAAALRILFTLTSGAEN